MVLEKKLVSSSYIKVINNIYNGATTKLKTIQDVTLSFPITIGLHK